MLWQRADQQEQPLWRLGVRIESVDDARRLTWLVRQCGQARVRAAARRRTADLAPRPQAVAAELRVQLPEEGAAAWMPQPRWRAWPANVSSRL